MTYRRLKKTFTIIFILTILGACSTSSETKNELNSNEEKNVSDQEPEVILAITQDGKNPPSEIMVENFGELLSSLKGYYTENTTNEMAEKLATAYDLAVKNGYEKSLLKFVQEFRNGVRNSVNTNVRYDFGLYLDIFLCYTSKCENGDSEALKYFDSSYRAPSRKSQYEIENPYLKQLEDQKIEEQEILEKLKQIAKRDWPDDYTTQEFWINQQMNDYRYMKMIPDDNIKKRAQMDWPLDFSTQKFWYNEQLAAKKRLDQK